MKSGILFVLLGFLATDSAKAIEKSHCDTLPKGSYTKSCTDSHIEPYTDEFGVSRCKLTALCGTLPSTRQKTVSTSLSMDESNFGPVGICEDIGVGDNGQLQCVGKSGEIMRP